MITKKHTVIGAVVVAAGLLVAACNEQRPAQTPNRDVQAQRAREAAEAVTFTDNAEITNIQRRLRLTANPNQLGFILLLNDAGQPIMYEGVVGKITSGGKSLRERDRVMGYATGSCVGCQQYVVRQAPSDEGTSGSSAEYIFYWNTDGAYRQWNGRYLYSDRPFRLRVEPLVVQVTGNN